MLTDFEHMYGRLFLLLIRQAGLKLNLLTSKWELHTVQVASLDDCLVLILGCHLSHQQVGSDFDQPLSRDDFDIHQSFLPYPFAWSDVAA